MTESGLEDMSTVFSSDFMIFQSSHIYGDDSNIKSFVFCTENYIYSFLLSLVSKGWENLKFYNQVLSNI